MFPEDAFNQDLILSLALSRSVQSINVFVFRGAHVGAELVGSEPKLCLEAEVSGIISLRQFGGGPLTACNFSKRFSDEKRENAESLSTRLWRTHFPQKLPTVMIRSSRQVNGNVSPRSSWRSEQVWRARPCRALSAKSKKSFRKLTALDRFFYLPKFC